MEIYLQGHNAGSQLSHGVRSLWKCIDDIKHMSCINKRIQELIFLKSMKFDLKIH
jgi:hypothetical protein